jgi:hypothetical protein
MLFNILMRSSSWVVDADRQTEMVKLIGAFLQLLVANVPKISDIYPVPREEFEPANGRKLYALWAVQSLWSTIT